jgi:hypothetical protein
MTPKQIPNYIKFLGFSFLFLIQKNFLKENLK